MTATRHNLPLTAYSAPTPPKADKIFHPDELLHILVFQYAALWKERAWLRDRVLFASKTRVSFFHDGKYASAHSEVMHELPYTLAILTSAEFKQLFGCSKKTRRYLCHACIDRARTRYDEFDFLRDTDACKTAFLDATGSHISCIMCGASFKVAKVRCNSAGCNGNLAGDNGDEHIGKCHSCGE